MGFLQNLTDRLDSGGLKIKRFAVQHNEKEKGEKKEELCYELGHNYVSDLYSIFTKEWKRHGKCVNGTIIIYTRSNHSKKRNIIAKLMVSNGRVAYVYRLRYRGNLYSGDICEGLFHGSGKYSHQCDSKGDGFDFMGRFDAGYPVEGVLYLKNKNRIYCGKFDSRESNLGICDYSSLYSNNYLMEIPKPNSVDERNVEKNTSFSIFDDSFSPDDHKLLFSGEFNQSLGSYVRVNGTEHSINPSIEKGAYTGTYVNGKRYKGISRHSTSEGYYTVRHADHRDRDCDKVIVYDDQYVTDLKTDPSTGMKRIYNGKCINDQGFCVAKFYKTLDMDHYVGTITIQDMHFIGWFDIDLNSVPIKYNVLGGYGHSPNISLDTTTPISKMTVNDMLSFDTEMAYIGDCTLIYNNYEYTGPVEYNRTTISQTEQGCRRYIFNSELYGLDSIITLLNKDNDYNQDTVIGIITDSKGKECAKGTFAKKKNDYLIVEGICYDGDSMYDGKYEYSSSSINPMLTEGSKYLVSSDGSHYNLMQSGRYANGIITEGSRYRIIDSGDVEESVIHMQGTYNSVGHVLNGKMYNKCGEIIYDGMFDSKGSFLEGMVYGK